MTPVRRARDEGARGHRSFVLPRAGMTTESAATVRAPERIAIARSFGCSIPTLVTQPHPSHPVFAADRVAGRCREFNAYLLRPASIDKPLRCRACVLMDQAAPSQAAALAGGIRLNEGWKQITNKRNEASSLAKHAAASSPS